MLNEYADAKGILGLENAKAYWWILKDDPSMHKQSGRWSSIGHMAALYQDELYEMTPTGRPSVSRLQEFGISLGYNRVVIYVEPDASKLNVSANTARTQLIVDNSHLPWMEWAAEFREKLPQPIFDMIEEASKKAVHENYNDKILERLQDIKSLFDPGFKRSRKKTGIKVGPIDEKEVGVKPGNFPHTPPSDDPNPVNPHPNMDITEILSVFSKNANSNGVKNLNLQLPKVLWISIADGTRKKDDDLEGRAARYLPSTNELQINEDFVVFAGLVEQLCRGQESKPGITSLATDTLREWYSQNIIESLLQAKALARSADYVGEDSKVLFTPEALTMAASAGRWMILQRTKQSLATKIGKGNNYEKNGHDASPGVTME